MDKDKTRRDLNKELKKIYKSLTKEEKEVFDRITKETEERAVLHPLGNHFRIGETKIHIISNCDDLEIIYETNEEIFFHYPSLYSSIEGKDLIESKKGYIYDLKIHQGKKKYMTAFKPSLFLESFSKDPDFKTIFCPVGHDEKTFTLRTRHVIENNDLALAYVEAIKLAGAGYDLKVISMLKRGKNDFLRDIIYI